MCIFAAAGGVGPAMDVLCCVPIVLFILGSFLASCYAMAAVSRKALVIAVVLCAFAGLVILVAYCCSTPNSDPDEVGNVEVLRNQLWWWIAAVMVTGVAAMKVIAKTRARRRTGSPDDRVS